MEVIYSVSFYIIVILAIIFAAASVLCKRTINSVICGFISLLMTGLLLISLGFSFLGAVQIALSASLASILLVFEVLFVKYRDEEKHSKKNIINILFSVIGILILILTVIASLRAGFFYDIFNNLLLPFNVSNNSFAENLFINYGASFIFSALIFLSAVLGFGVILADKDVKGEDE